MAEEFNPKDAIGRTKLPVHLWPSIATAYGSIGMLEGQTKYGRSNFRAAKVAASVYYAAAKRHLDAWFEGEENTKEGGPHLGNALACIAIILDAKLVGTLVDDRQYNPVETDAFSKMVDELTAQGRDLVKNLKIAQEPKHWDRRAESADQTEEFTKEAEKVLATPTTYMTLSGQRVLLPPSVHMDFTNGISARIRYEGPLPGFGTAVPLSPHEQTLVNSGWSIGQAWMVTMMRAANPNLMLEFIRVHSDDEELSMTVKV